MNKATRYAIAAALTTTLMGSSAMAADLGGNCCADLEERIAELEATTVRKGNRKVSLTISGFVSHNVMWWDDGVRSDMYIGDGGNYGSRFRFKGEAKINPELTAGFLYEFGISNNGINNVDQEHRVQNCALLTGNPVVVPPNCAPTGNQRDNGDDLGGGFALRDTTVFLRHARLGQVKFGHGSTATDNLVLIDLAGLNGASTPDVALYGGGMKLSRATPLAGEGYFSSVFTWQAMINAGNSWDTARKNHILYETPTLQGFTVQAAVAEDNYWDIALRYAGEFNGVRVAFGIGYQEDSEFNTRIKDTQFLGGSVRCDGNCDRKETELKGALSVMHVPTGLFFTGSAGSREVKNHQTVDVVNGNVRSFGDRDASYWHVSGGVARNFSGIGNTVLFAEYGNHSDMLGLNTALERFGGIVSSEATNWGIGINQHIDAAAMEIFVTYKHFEGSFVSDGVGAAPARNIATGLNELNDMSLFMVGSRISF